MGRTLDALMHREGRHFKEKHFLEDALEKVADVHPSHEEATEEMPFIEIGAGRKMEGSPQVLGGKHPPQPSVRPPHVAATFVTPPAPAQEAPRVEAPRVEAPHVELTEPAPMSLTLEPWPTRSRSAPGLAPDIIAYHHPDHPLSKQYRHYLDKMLESCQATPNPAMLLAGCRPQVGTSTVLLNLAVAGSLQSQKRIAVVDLQLAAPTLAARLGYTAGPGVQDVFLGKLALEQALVHTAVGTLHLVGARGATPEMQLNPEAVHWLLGWLRGRYDLILVDGPPLEAAANVSILAQACDAVFLVVPRGEQQQNQRQFAQALSGMGGRLRGLLHTHWEV